MNNSLITLAIHTREKAEVLKNILENRGIQVILEKVDDGDRSEISDSRGYYVKIKSTELSSALSIIEENKLFSYSDKDTYRIDDGRSRILVAVDFSSYSMKACQVAFNIAKKLNAKVKILHIFNNIYFPSNFPFADSLKDSEDDGLLDKTRKLMLDLCCDIDNKITSNEWPSVNYSYSIREGIVDEEIESFVDEYKPFLLVLGTKGKSNNRTSVLGNVTADVIETVNVPVLAIPENLDVSSESNLKLAYLTNLQPRDIKSFDTLVRIFSLYPEVKITLLHINVMNAKGEKWPQNQLEQMSRKFKEIYPQLNIGYKLIDSQDITEAVSEYVEKENITVVCLNTKRRSLFGRIFLPSISRKVLDRSAKALLVLRGE